MCHRGVVGGCKVCSVRRWEDAEEIVAPGGCAEKEQQPGGLQVLYPWDAVEKEVLFGADLGKSMLHVLRAPNGGAQDLLFILTKFLLYYDYIIIQKIL